MTRLRKSLVITGIAASILGLTTATASADTTAQPPDQTTCYPLQSLIVCTIPVNVDPNIGPFGPFNFTFPNGIFGPPPSSTP